MDTELYRENAVDTPGLNDGAQWDYACRHHRSSTNYGNIKADPRASKIPHGNLGKRDSEAVPKLTAALNRVRFRTK